MPNKIVLIEIAGRGGICHYTYNLAVALSSIAHVVLVTGRDYEFRERAVPFEIRGYFNRLRTNPLVVLRLLTLCRQPDVAAVHFQLSQYPAVMFIMLVLVRLFSDKKIILTAHNVESHEGSFAEAFLNRYLYSVPHTIIVHAMANKTAMIEKFGITPARITVIPHGNYGFFVPDGYYCPPPAAGRNILFFGFIRKYKGLHYMLKALQLIKGKIPGVQLYIVGKPVEEFKSYRDEIDALGIADNIKTDLEYIPFEKVKEYFQMANVVVLPYLNIYQSGILQLSLAFGRPAVATNVGGLPEVVEDGYSGFIVPPADPVSLADKIIVILSDYSLQKKMGENALRLSQSKYSWEAISRLTSVLYEDHEKNSSPSFQVLMYHAIGSARPDRYTVSRDDFEQQCAYISSHGFASMATDDVAPAENTQQGKKVIISFDDGVMTDYLVAAPVLKRLGLNAVFFVTTSFIGQNGYMDWPDVIDLHRQGFDVQSHGHAHALLATLPQERIRDDLATSKRLLEERLGSRVSALSLPGGSYNRAVIETARACGYSHIFTSMPGGNGWKEQNTGIFRRMIIKGDTSFDDFKRIAEGDRETFTKLRSFYFLRNLAKTVIHPRAYYRIWKTVYKG